jgi:hypothetical protein
MRQPQYLIGRGGQDKDKIGFPNEATRALSLLAAECAEDLQQRAKPKGKRQDNGHTKEKTR